MFYNKNNKYTNKQKKFHSNLQHFSYPVKRQSIINIIIIRQIINIIQNMHAVFYYCR